MCEACILTIDKLFATGDNIGMPFNTDKCRSMHFRSRNLKFNYSMGGEWLEQVDTHKNLGVMIDNNMKFSNQAQTSKNKANQMLGYIKHNVSYRSRFVMLRLYNSYVRPHLEYCQQAVIRYGITRVGPKTIDKTHRRAWKTYIRRKTQYVLYRA